LFTAKPAGSYTAEGEAQLIWTGGREVLFKIIRNRGVFEPGFNLIPILVITPEPQQHFAQGVKGD